MKSMIFDKELNLIKDENIKNVVRFIFEVSPDYFYKIPASSTGKYHPFINQGEGGLVRHTKLAVAVAIDSFRLEKFNFNDKEKDLIIMSVLLHDIYKCGIKPTPDELTGSKTDFEHPRLASRFINACNTELKNKNKPYLQEDEIKFVMKNIESHMGQWNKQEGHEDLPIPTTPAQFCVSNADYMASRKFYDQIYLKLLTEKGYDIILDPTTNELLKNNAQKTDMPLIEKEK